MPTPVIVPDDHMRTLLSDMTPGSKVSSTGLYTRYLKLMAELDRPAASRLALGRALTRVGCERKRTRRCHGPRGRQRVKETHCWVLPGMPPPDPETAHIHAMIRRLGGDGIYSLAAIWEAYQRTAREEGWRDSLSQGGLMTRLTQLGYPRRSMYQGRWTRYLFVPRNI